jgi:hypothetical protein
LKADYENRVLECQITRWERLNDWFTKES